NLSVDQACAIFVGAGLQVDLVETWDWLNPPVSTFQVHDIARNHVLLVQVYPDIARAQRGSERMVDGYSASTWIDNLALFEANADDYQQVMAAASARSQGMQSETGISIGDVRPGSVDRMYTDLVVDAISSSASRGPLDDRGRALTRSIVDV